MPNQGELRVCVYDIVTDRFVALPDDMQPPEYRPEDTMGAMNRPIEDADIEALVNGVMKRTLETLELEWGIYTVDADGVETLLSATLTQEAAIAVAVALGDGPARHMRVRRLR